MGPLVSNPMVMEIFLEIIVIFNIKTFGFLLQKLKTSLLLQRWSFYGTKFLSVV